MNTTNLAPTFVTYVAEGQEIIQRLDAATSRLCEAIAANNAAQAAQPPTTTQPRRSTSPNHKPSTC